LRRNSEHHQDHQRHGDDQRALDVAQRGADRGRAVDRDVDVDRGEIDACSCGISAFTRSTVSMMLAPGWR
jgi:hypothetical protein